MNKKTLQVFDFAKMLFCSTALLLLCSLLLAGCGNAVFAPSEDPTATAQPPTPQKGGIRITKYPENYTAFKIETGNGVTIITDPFIMNEQIHADIVTESHQHLDHTDVSKILEPYTLLAEPGVFDLDGVKITGVAGLHNKPDPYDDLSGSNIIYVFDLGDIRLAQFASQGAVPNDAMFAQIGQVDVLVIQFFSTGGTKLSTSEAAQIAQRLSARVIIPAHGDPSLNEKFAKELGADFKEEPSGVLNLTPGDLDQLKTPVVIVLDH